MMIEQQNARGGLLGRPIEPVIVNPHSDAKAYAELAGKLISEHKVAAIFGCWSSASRKEVLPIVERDNALLFYPSQYEGEEASRSIFYLGATPPQQAIPAVNFLRDQGIDRFFWSVPTTSIRAPPTRSSKATWRARKFSTSPSAIPCTVKKTGVQSSSAFAASPRVAAPPSSRPFPAMPMFISSANWQIRASDRATFQ